MVDVDEIDSDGLDPHHRLPFGRGRIGDVLEPENLGTAWSLDANGFHGCPPSTDAEPIVAAQPAATSDRYTRIVNEEHRAMITDEELKVRGVHALIAALGDVQAGRFVSLLTRAPFDYTKWQADLWPDQGVEALSRAAMEMRKASRREE